MTIPLDNLYDYIFSLTGHNNKNLKMFRFSPHGSKSIKNLICHNPVEKVFVTIPNANEKKSSWHYKLLFCYDQEPLNFDYYKNNFDDIKKPLDERGLMYEFNNNLYKNILKKKNISAHPMISNSVYDKKLLLHSEVNSKELIKYEKNNFLGIYYWSHAFIALDWYRFAKHDKMLQLLPKQNFKKDFNIYCRAWTGSRQYRLKFLELLKEKNIDKKSNIFFNEYDCHIHYSNYNPENTNWKFKKENLDGLKKDTTRNINSSASATYDVYDYKNSAVDVVLETVFDCDKIQLTEKILRPIACGKPFILVSEKDSLNFLRSYGFKTFGSLISEEYDQISDPLKRLYEIVNTMERISNLNSKEKNNLFLKMHQIAEYNKKWLFSNDFFNLINGELKKNIAYAFKFLDNPRYQTAKEIRTEYRALRAYNKYLTGSAKDAADEAVFTYPERIELSKKNIGKY